MLTSILAVIVLVVIGIWAVYVGIMGRAARGDPALAAPKRIVMMVAGLGAFTVAYFLYVHPSVLESSNRAPKSWNAMPSNPPETRGDNAAQAAAASVDPATSASIIAAAETAEATEASEPPAAAAAPAPAPAKPVATAATEPVPIPAEDGGEVSATAAAMEAELIRRRKRLPDLPGETPRPAVVAEADSELDAAEPAPAPRAAPAVPRSSNAGRSSAVIAEDEPATPPRRSTPTRRSTGSSDRSDRYVASTPRVGPRQPLTIVIYNELGDRQERETLSLVIEGKRVASFEITDAAPVIELPVNLPRPGLIHYKLEGESIQGRRQTLTGQGCISAVEGARFHVRRKPGSQRVFLESTSG